MKLVFRKSTGEVVMLGQFSDNEALSSIELPTDPQMTQGYQMKIKDGAIEYEKPWWMIKDEEVKQKHNDLIKNIADIKKATTIEELKPLLLKIINPN